MKKVIQPIIHYTYLQDQQKNPGKGGSKIRMFKLIQFAFEMDQYIFNIQGEGVSDLFKLKCVLYCKNIIIIIDDASIIIK
jgi:hypothetical protein